MRLDLTDKKIIYALDYAARQKNSKLSKDLRISKQNLHQEF